MTSTDRLAEMAAEIERACDPTQTSLTKMTEGMNKIMEERAEMAAEIERLRARITELEAAIAAAAALSYGTMGALTPDEPTTVTHDIPPNAPR